MTEPHPAVSFGTFQWVVSGLMVAIVGLFVFSIRSVTDGISELKKTTADISSELARTREDTAKQFGDLNAGIASSVGGVRDELIRTNGKLDVTNSRLDNLIAETSPTQITIDQLREILSGRGRGLDVKIAPLARSVDDVKRGGAAANLRLSSPAAATLPLADGVEKH